MAYNENEEDEEERRRRQALRPRRVTEPEAEELALPGVDLSPRPAGAGPYVSPSESATPPTMRANGRAVIRPEMVSTGDQLADVQEYRRKLEGYTDPKASDHWAVAALKKGVEGAARGAAATGTLTGALGGGLAGGLYGAAAPDVTERDWRDREKIKAAGLEQQELARRKTSLDFASTLADVGYKQSRAAYEDARPELERERNESNLRRIEGGLDAALRRAAESERANRAREEDRDADRGQRDRFESGRNDDRDADRASREKVAQWRVTASKEIAAAARQVQRERTKLSAEQFRQRYPGAGLALTPDDIARKAKAAGMYPEKAAELAVRQGYTILDR